MLQLILLRSNVSALSTFRAQAMSRSTPRLVAPSKQIVSYSASSKLAPPSLQKLSTTHTTRTLNHPVPAVSSPAPQQGRSISFAKMMKDIGLDPSTTTFTGGKLDRVEAPSSDVHPEDRCEGSSPDATRPLPHSTYDSNIIAWMVHIKPFADHKDLKQIHAHSPYYKQIIRRFDDIMHKAMNEERKKETTPLTFDRPEFVVALHLTGWRVYFNLPYRYKNAVLALPGKLKNVKMIKGDVFDEFAERAGSEEESEA